MVASLIYGLVAGGFVSLTGRFWASLIWPWYAGKILAAIVMQKEAITLAREAAE